MKLTWLFIAGSTKAGFVGSIPTWGNPYYFPTSGGRLGATDPGFHQNA